MKFIDEAEDTIERDRVLEIVKNQPKQFQAALYSIILNKENSKTRHVQTGTGEGNQSEMTLHFGLGNLKGPLDAEILWPGKVTTISKGLKINSLHKVMYKKE